MFLLVCLVSFKVYSFSLGKAYWFYLSNLSSMGLNFSSQIHHKSFNQLGLFICMFNLFHYMVKPVSFILFPLKLKSFCYWKTPEFILLLFLHNYYLYVLIMAWILYSNFFIYSSLLWYYVSKIDKHF